MRINDVALLHVSDSEHEIRDSVALTNDGIPRENYILRALLWPREFSCDISEKGEREREKGRERGRDFNESVY